jgi:hypothetical protein
MNAVADIVAVQEAEAPDRSFERAEARLRDLEDLRAICMSIARLVQRQALAEVEQTDAQDAPTELMENAVRAITLAARGDVGLVIDRVARSVRLTIAQEERLEKALRDRRAGLEDARRQRAMAETQAVAKARRDEVERVMLAAIHSKHGGGHENLVERDRDYLYDHFDREDFAERPISEVVRRLCDMLGLRPDWDRWCKERWADEEVEAGVPGTPYVADDAPEPKPRARRGRKPVEAGGHETPPRSDSS